MSGFTKLFSSLIFSTVWREEMHVKVVWITMLAMANRNGEVLASVPGLADAARVSLPQVRDALRKLGGPDRDSRTKEHQGRRIVEVDGGWRLLNYLKYREIRDADERRIQTREAVQRHREREKKAKRLTVSTVSPGKPPKAQAEAEAEAEAKKTLPTAAPSRDTWLTPFSDAWRAAYGGEPAYGELAKAIRPLVSTLPVGEVLDHWNRFLGSVDGQYAKPSKFAQTYGRWAKPDRGKEPLPDMYLTLEEQAARRAKREGTRRGPERVGDLLPPAVLEGRAPPDAQ